MSEPQKTFYSISETADIVEVPKHVLRFWETKFSQIRPIKRAGNRRYYRIKDIQLIKRIKNLLYTDGYTIRGVQKLLLEESRKTTKPVKKIPPKQNKQVAEEPANQLMFSLDAEPAQELTSQKAEKSKIENAAKISQVEMFPEIPPLAEDKAINIANDKEHKMSNDSQDNSLEIDNDNQITIDDALKVSNDQMDSVPATINQDLELEKVDSARLEQEEGINKSLERTRNLQSIKQELSDIQHLLASLKK